jgi:hypothetical protein
MAAQQLVSAGELSRARQFLSDGIRHAETQGKKHAAEEMSELHSVLDSAPGEAALR